MLKRQFSGYVFEKNVVKYCNHTPGQFMNASMDIVILGVHRVKNGLLKGDVLNRFMYESMCVWNNNSQSIAKIMVPPVTADDEVQTLGYGMALIKLLTIVGLLEYESQPMESSKTSWKLGDNYKGKRVYLCLDGLSIDRHRLFKKRLGLLPGGFVKAYEQSVVFKKALEQVVPIPGPLHMAFHMLQSIYIVFDKLLLIAQKCLKWKRIYPTKISNCYR